MIGSRQLFIFTLDEFRYALDLQAVERVFPAVEVRPLPRAPEIIMGVVDIRGRIVPVVNIRRRFRLPEREMDLGDRLILTRTPRRTLALLADSVSGIMEVGKEEVLAPRDLIPGVEYVAGVVKLQEGILLIHDLDTFLSLDEEERLEKVLQGRKRR